MEVEELLKELNIERYGELSSGVDGYVFDIRDSDAYGAVYIQLENSSKLDILPDNQVVTDEGSSLLFEAKGSNYLLNLIADWNENKYQLVFTKVGD